MKQLINFISALYARFQLTAKDQKGQGLVEYALIIVLVALAAILAMKYLGGSINNTYSSAASSLTNAGS